MPFGAHCNRYVTSHFFIKLLSEQKGALERNPPEDAGSRKSHASVKCISLILIFPSALNAPPSICPLLSFLRPPSSLIEGVLGGGGSLLPVMTNSHRGGAKSTIHKVGK